MTGLDNNEVPIWTLNYIIREENINILHTTRSLCCHYLLTRHVHIVYGSLARLVPGSVWGAMTGADSPGQRLASLQ